MSRLAPIADALDALAKAVRALDDDREALVDQTTSPLGPRVHCKAVKRRLAAGATGASIVGRRHFLSADALQQELARVSKRTTNNIAPAEHAPRTVEERIARKLSRVK